MIDQIIVGIVISVFTGGACSMATVVALNVHIKYITEKIARHEKSIGHAHERISEIMIIKGSVV
jgi:hypothetical protein